MEKPKKIYKYQSINQYSLRNLKNNHIFFNHPDDFNDPFDTFHQLKIKEISKSWLRQYVFQNDNDRLIFERVENGEGNSSDIQAIYTYLSKEIPDLKSRILTELNIDPSDKTSISFEQLIRELTNPNNIQKIISNLFYELINESFEKILNSFRFDHLGKIGLSCFAEENDNLLMWSHYADSHKGFCLEFDTDYDPFTKIFSVKYSRVMPEISIEQVLMTDEKNIELLKSYLFIKSQDWWYEKEWRVLHYENKIPFTYKTNALTAVYFGLKVNRTDFEIIASIIKSHHSKCAFYFMNKVPGLYKLVPQGISYNTFSEAKTFFSSVLSEKIKKGERDIDKLIQGISSNIPPQHLKIIVESIIDDIQD